MPEPGPTLVGIGIIRRAGRFLIRARPAGTVYAGYWEFPGGKVEPGETPERALVRELDEELGVRARLLEVLPGPDADGLWRLSPRHLMAVWTAVADTAPAPLADHDELHTILSTLPLFPFMDVLVTPLARHPSAIERD